MCRVESDSDEQAVVSGERLQLLAANLRADLPYACKYAGNSLAALQHQANDGILCVGSRQH